MQRTPRRLKFSCLKLKGFKLLCNKELLEKANFWSCSDHQASSLLSWSWLTSTHPSFQGLIGTDLLSALPPPVTTSVLISDDPFHQLGPFSFPQLLPSLATKYLFLLIQPCLSPPWQWWLSVFWKRRVNDHSALHFLMLAYILCCDFTILFVHSFEGG